MILSVSPVKISACSFRGDDKKTGDNSPRVKDVSTTVDQFATEINETADALAHGMDGVTNGVGTVGTSALGLWTLLKKPFVGIYEYFTKAAIDENGKAITEKILDSKTGEVVDKIVRKADWKKIGIAGGVVAGGVALLAITKKVIDNKNAKAEKVEEPKTEAVKVETEEV